MSNKLDSMESSATTTTTVTLESPRKRSLVSWIKVPRIAVNGSTWRAGTDHVVPLDDFGIRRSGDQSNNGSYSGRFSNSDTNSHSLKKKTTLSELAKYEDNIYTAKKDYDSTQNGDCEVGHYQVDNLYGDSLSASSLNGKKFEGFGWVRGVLIRCVLCIFGATLFLRMSWIVGQAGLLYGVCILLLSFVVVVVTSISMSAIATNGEVKNGGIYYLISRSLGPEFGGSIGFILYIANVINASMNCVGLAETIVPLLKEELDFQLVDGGANDIRLYGLASCLVLQLIIFIGTEFENKTQLILLATICVSLVSHFVGTILPVSETQAQRGFVGYSLAVFMENMLPDFSPGINFITLFGIYFPAMTGIMAGANMSGDLRDPSQSIPRGTFYGIAVTTLIYAWCMFLPAATTIRNADGVTLPQWDATLNRYLMPDCGGNGTGHCHYGLRNNYEVITLQSAWPPLVTAGIFATTLSSASGCLIGAPRIFQALCEDELFPLIKVFAKGHGANNDPFRAYFLTFFIASAVILIGDLNIIASLITNFFLAAFAITNFACFDASTAKSPGFRPGFQFYNRWLSLFGSVLCISIMFMLSWQTSLITFFVFTVLFIFIKNNKSHVNWGSSTEANRYRKALISLLKITRTAQHVKNYRPQLLVLTGNPAARKALIDFAYCITNGQNLMLCGQIIPHKSSVPSTALIRKLNDHFTDWLYEHHVKAFYCAVANVSLRAGVQCLLQTVGLGKMQPNILLLGYNNKWLAQALNDFPQYEEYAGVVSDAFESNLSVCVFRNENEGLDHSALLSEEERLFVRLPDLLLSNADSALNDDVSRGVTPRPIRPKAGRAFTDEVLHTSKSDHHLPALFDRISSETLFRGSDRKNRHNDHKLQYDSGRRRPPLNDKFRTRIHGGVVDVWWLFDDGGLTFLLSYLLTTQNTYLPNAKMRVFTICGKEANAQRIHDNLSHMLKKFRIQFTSLRVLVEDASELYEETVTEYEELLKMLNPTDSSKRVIPEEILKLTDDRTHRYLRHRELLLEYSSASSIVIITLPLATPSIVKSAAYMIWLELLSRDMPPMLFIRGNQTSVITYYS